MVLGAAGLCTLTAASASGAGCPFPTVLPCILQTSAQVPEKRLPPEWASLPVHRRKRPDKLMGVVSYSTDMIEKGDGLGQLFMLAFTNILADEHGVPLKQKPEGKRGARQNGKLQLPRWRMTLAKVARKKWHI